MLRAGTKRWGLACVAVAMVAALSTCLSRSTSPPRTAAEIPDAGLPLPSPSTKSSVIVPSDVGFGEGAAGPSTQGGTRPSGLAPAGGQPSPGQ